MKRWRLVRFTIAFALLCIIFVFPQNQSKEEYWEDLIVRSFYDEDLRKIRAFCWNSKDIGNETSGRWIVLTTSHYVPWQIQKICSLEGWNVAAVGEKMAKNTLTCKNLHFITYEYQSSLGPFFETGLNSLLLDLQFHAMLSFRSYAKKNYGYIYAIMHGAQWIYDIDDSVIPSAEELSKFDFGDYISGMQFEATRTTLLSKKIFNPLLYFGNEWLKPRGFPMEYWKDHKNCKECFSSCRKMQASVIQHGVIRGNPDTDSILKLVNHTIAGNYFSKFTTPITLKGGTFAPWNSLNTLFGQKAFLYLFLPPLPERVADTLRSYFAQKQLQLFGKTVTFYLTNVTKEANSRQPLDMITEESKFCNKTIEIIAFLDSWKCKSTDSAECFLELAKEFSNFYQTLNEANDCNGNYYPSKLKKADGHSCKILCSHNFWDRSAYLAAQQWVKYLKLIQYKFSEVSVEFRTDYPRIRNCRRAYFDSKAHCSSGKKLEAMEALLHWCMKDEIVQHRLHAPTPRHLDAAHLSNDGIDQKKDTVLLIINNHPWNTTTDLLQLMYENYFAVTIFCGTFAQQRPSINSFNFIEVYEDELLEGRFLYYCLLKVAELRIRNVVGYFVSADDLIFNFWHTIDLKRAFHPIGIRAVQRVTYWYQTIFGTPALRRTKLLVEMMYKDYPKVQRVWKRYDKGISSYLQTTDASEHLISTSGFAPCDLFYVPLSEISYFCGLMELFFEAGVYKGIAVLKYLATVNHTVPPISKSKFLWDEDRGHYGKFYNTDLILLHPIKPSSLSIARNRKM